MNNTHSNPWAGLASYQDPASADRQLLFCGRVTETNELGRLVDDNIFVTLYGKSGIGKTSLLNAGVFPLLRRQGYLPLSLRLGMEAVGSTFQQCIVRRIAQACTVTEVPVVAPCADECDTEWLWNWFARMRFSVDGRPVFPVVVFDQMEEVFRDRRTEAETLLRQIHYMMDEGHALPPRTLADGSRYDYDFNFRFVASLREDDLYRLEDSLDRCYLPTMKRCRYRLQALGDASAAEVVQRPGEGVLAPADAAQIADAVIDMARSDQDGSISTNLLSLLCSRLYAGMESRHADSITLPMLYELMKDNPIIQFYNEATAGFRSKELYYIENSLVDVAGRRNSVSEGEFRLHVRNADRLLEGENKILQRTSVGSDAQDYRIELIHDSFCAPLIENRERRGGKKMLWWMAAGFVLLYAIVLAMWKPIETLRHVDAQESFHYSMLHAAYSQQALSDGDVDLAIRLALEAMNCESWRGWAQVGGRQIWTYENVYTPSADAALRAAMQRHPAFAYLFEADTMVGFGDIMFRPIVEGQGSFLDRTHRRLAMADTTLRIYAYDCWAESSDGHGWRSDSVKCRLPIATYRLDGYIPCEIGHVADTVPNDWLDDSEDYYYGGITVCLRDGEKRCRSFRYPYVRKLVEVATEYYKDRRWTDDEVFRYRIGKDNLAIAYSYEDTEFEY